MIELFDKEVNAQKENSNKTSCKLPQAHKKVCDENERKKQSNKERKNNTHIKMLLMKGSTL